MGCAGGKRAHEHVYGYTESFFEAYPDLPRFAYSHFWESHRGGRFARILEIEANETRAESGQGPHSLRMHLERLLSPAHGPTVAIVMGDHGNPHEVPDQQTPFLSLLFSPGTLDRIANADAVRRALLENRVGLFTHLDIHETVRDLIRSFSRGVAELSAAPQPRNPRLWHDVLGVSCAADSRDAG